MRKYVFALGAVAAIALPAVAQAQAFAGVSAGYHDLGYDPDVTIQVEDFEIHDGSVIYGAFVGYDFPVGTGAFAGVEGNFHLGTDVVENEYGANARVGFADAGGAKYYVRGGYQWVEIDPFEITDEELPEDTFDGVDTSGGDFLVGAGVEFPISGNSMLRVNVDSVGLDTVRGTAGFGFRF